MLLPSAWVKPWVKVVFRKVPNYITKARASYQLVRGVPTDCQAHVGKKKWKEGGGKTVSQARAKLPGFLARTDAEIRQARGEQLTPEEWVIRLGDHPGLKAGDLADAAAPHVSQYLDDGSVNPVYERVLATAEAVKAGKGNALLSVDGLLQARRLDREPGGSTYQGWRSALLNFMAFSGKARPGLCTPADAEGFKDYLLTIKARSSTKTVISYLAALWATLVAKEGQGENIFQPLIHSLGETIKTRALKAAESKRFKSFEPTIPIEDWTGSKYLDVFRILYYSGCRKAEVAGLKVDDIHDDYFSVEWSEERSLKTANSVRDIPIHPAIKSMLHELRDGTVGNLWPSLMFTQKVDGVDVIRWGGNLSKGCKRVTGLRPKDFRDRVIGQLRSNNFNQVLIERLSGHSASTMNSQYGGNDWEMYRRMVNSIK